MKGSIIERGESLQLRVSLGKNPSTGKYDVYTETFKGTNHTKAAVRLRELLTELDKGTFVKPGKQTVKEYFDSWLVDISGPNKTYQGYKYNVDRYIIPAFGNLALTGLKPEHIKTLCSEQKAKGHHRTAQYIYSTFSKALNDALKMGLIMRNPVDGVPKPKVERHQFKTLSEDDLNQFLDAIKSSEYYPLFFTDLFTAMRRSELLAIRYKDLDLFGMTVSVNRTVQQLKNAQTSYRQPKTPKSRRLIALTPANCVVLREHKAKQELQRQALGLPPLSDDDLVFSHYDGKSYLPDSVSHAWIKLVRLNGFTGVRLHDARHSHATILLNKGVHPKIVQERLGHANIGTTLDIYSHVAPGMQAAAALKFDEVLRPKENKLDQELKAIIQN